MDKPIISIIIPTYNRAHLIVETLESIRRQTYEFWQCIIVDDGSTDNTVAVIKDYIKEDSRFSVHKRPEQLPKGANACRNYGLELSKGEYVQFFDSDDIMLEFCLYNRLKLLANSNYDFVIFSMGLLNGGTKTNDRTDIVVNDWEEALRAFLGSNKLPWNLQRTLYKASLIKDKIAFNLSLKRFQDIEFNIRLLLQFKPHFKIVSEIDCYYRVAGEDNPRTKDFYNNVFKSIPIYLSSVCTEVPRELIIQYKVPFQQWIYNITALYTVKGIPPELYNNVLRACKEYIGISQRQALILKLLFFGKRNLKNIRGSSRYFNFLKSKF